MTRIKDWNAGTTMLKTIAVALVILLIVLLTGHGDVFETSAATRADGPSVRVDEPQMCTEIGCTSGLFADLGAVRSAFPKARSVKLCLAGSCRIIARRDLSSVEIPARDLVAGDKPVVRMVVRNRKGKAISRSTVKAEVVEVQPNGEGCPPICHQVHVKAGSSGRLRAA